MFDPELFGEAMGAAIREAISPLVKRIDQLEQLLQNQVDVPAEIQRAVNAAVAELPAPRDGKDAPAVDVEALVKTALARIPVPQDGKQGEPGLNGKDAPPVDTEALVKAVLAQVRIPADGKPGEQGPPGEKGQDAGPVDTVEVIKAVLAQIPKPADGKDGAPGKDGKDGINGERGEKGADGHGVAGAMIDRDGALQLTLSNGEVKNLGPVVGKDGADGADGLSLDGFEMEYLPESHEITVKATAAGRAKEVRYPAGGIRPGGYWRDGTKAQAGEAWVHDGSLYIAKNATSAKPESNSQDWIIAARKGRDGERGQKGADGAPPAPIKLGA